MGGGGGRRSRRRRTGCWRLGLIQVQRRCRRLYDDEEHLGDRRDCNFHVAQTSHLYTAPPLYACTYVYIYVCVQAATSCARSGAPPVRGPICIWTRARGDASSIISLGIIPSTRGTPTHVFPARAFHSARGFHNFRAGREDASATRDEIIEELRRRVTFATLEN